MKDDKQIVENLDIAFELHETAIELIKERVLRKNPLANKQDINKEIAKWLRKNHYKSSPTLKLASQKEIDLILNGPEWTN